jgi:hypothetical protein
MKRRNHKDEECFDGSLEGEKMSVLKKSVYAYKISFNENNVTAIKEMKTNFLFLFHI